MENKYDTNFRVFPIKNFQENRNVGKDCPKTNCLVYNSIKDELTHRHESGT